MCRTQFRQLAFDEDCSQKREKVAKDIKQRLEGMLRACAKDIKGYMKFAKDQAEKWLDKIPHNLQVSMRSLGANQSHTVSTSITKRSPTSKSVNRICEKVIRHKNTKIPVPNRAPNLLKELLGKIQRAKGCDVPCAIASHCL